MIIFVLHKSIIIIKIQTFHAINMSIIELVVPVIGESIAEVTLSSWLKEDGAYVELDEIICEFESEKATV